MPDRHPPASPGGHATGGHATGGHATGGQADLTDIPCQWAVTGTEELARGRLLTVRRDMVKMPGGSVAGRELVEHPGAVAVVALDDTGQVLLIRQYRHPAGALLWEVPAGLRDVAGEPLLDTGQRELLEETGYRAADWRVLADIFTSPGCSTERLRIFLARGVTEVPAAERDYVPVQEEAELEVAWVPLDEAVRRFLAGDLHNGVAGVGILSAYAARAEGFSGLREVSAPESL